MVSYSFENKPIDFFFDEYNFLFLFVNDSKANAQQIDPVF